MDQFQYLSISESDKKLSSPSTPSDNDAPNDNLQPFVQQASSQRDYINNWMLRADEEHLKRLKSLQAAIQETEFKYLFSHFHDHVMQSNVTRVERPTSTFNPNPSIELSTMHSRNLQ